MVFLLIRVIWFLLVGWWLGQLALLLAWLLIVTIIGLPIGILILNRLPEIITLRPYTRRTAVRWVGGSTVVETAGLRQLPFWVRAVYFVLIGWWFSLIWLEVAFLLGLTIVLLPVSFLMFSKSAAVTTLRRI
jgi:uncharacterized membrane protein YccF (DUF307 family)